ncbi:PREDICTED: uncharacterized protein At2g29880-like [Theobroma cacao]|uniref:Uncharacterized protein At2g29880-like n=1 Tax=Theobroma cacao TaxID=3641 RepID=A0AB32WRU2_THECC|nr:PREDICTED: uncharacterized protein At2g29880-like [Theobroma cacao]
MLVDGRCISQGLGRTSKKSTHQWTPTEDGVLINSCIDLVNERSWGRNNGTFKPGYLQQLEKWMKERILNCNIRAIPHINSRMRLLKTQYREVAEMISHSTSGFGWDDVKKCVTCDDDVWIGWVKIYPAAAGLRNNPFPHFDQLAIIFGKDRAIGEGAKSPADAVENIETEEVAFATTRVASEAFNALTIDEDDNGDDDVFLLKLPIVRDLLLLEEGL